MSDTLNAPLSRNAFEAFKELMQEYKSALVIGIEHWTAKHAELPLPEAVTPEKIELLFDKLQTLDRHIPRVFSLTGVMACQDGFKEKLKAFFSRSEVRLLHLVRFFVLFGTIRQSNESLFANMSEHLYWTTGFWQFFEKSHPGEVTYGKIGDILKSLGIDDMKPGWYVLSQGNLIEEENMSYYFDRPSLLRDGLMKVEQSWYFSQQKTATLKILQKMPEVPGDILDIVWNFALAEAKTHRLDAQLILDKLPETLPRLLEELKSTQSGRRSVVAQWLGRLRNSETIKPLQDTLKKEKIDATRVEIMKALDLLGISLNDLLNRKQLLNEADKTLKKGIPKSLQWFPFDKMPPIHWNDGTVVDPKILQHWLVQATKMKMPEPNPLVVLYGRHMNRPECNAVARFVLESWIAEDMRPATEEDCMEWMKRDISASYLSTMTPQQCQYYIDSKLGQHLATANDSKGILGLVAAWGDETLPAVMEKYVRDWYGNRVHQSRALVMALGGMENMVAIQALLSISRKMKTKSIREEAEKAIQNIAERNDWTLDQLADRTAPTAGLDERGEIVFDLGARKLTGRWETEPKLSLYDESGKSLKTFPGQLKSDDESLYSEAKKSFQAANKLLKTTVAQQTERLYEAMCSGRTWTFDEWSMYILRHPILGQLACGLVWGVFDMDGEIPSVIFRPLEDGTLTDVDDNPVELVETDRIRIVHSLNLSPEQIKTWTEHLGDYDVKPFFPQFGQKPYRLPDEKRRETKIADFYGAKVMAFNLRSVATKLGFVRGETGDGGWFHEYVKPMQGLELNVVLEFSGNGLPEENNEVELYDLVFRTKQGRELPLEKVPPILLSEMVRSLETIAATPNKTK